MVLAAGTGKMSSIPIISKTLLSVGSRVFLTFPKKFIDGDEEASGLFALTELLKGIIYNYRRCC
jgi:hypothetical protein